MEVKWCSLDRLVQGDEIVYPALLPYLLPAIIAAATRYGPAS